MGSRAHEGKTVMGPTQLLFRASPWWLSSACGPGVARQVDRLIGRWGQETQGPRLGEGRGPATSSPPHRPGCSPEAGSVAQLTPHRGDPESRSPSSFSARKFTKGRGMLSPPKWGSPGARRVVSYEVWHTQRMGSHLLPQTGGSHEGLASGGGVVSVPLSSAPPPTPGKAQGLEAQPASLWDLEGGQAPHCLHKLGPVRAAQGRGATSIPLGLLPKSAAHSPGGAGFQFSLVLPGNPGGRGAYPPKEPALKTTFLKAQTPAEHQVHTGRLPTGLAGKGQQRNHQAQSQMSH